MSNSYYNRTRNYTPGTRARGDTLEASLDSIEDGFDSVEANIQTDGTMSQNFDGDSTYKLINMIDGSDTQDYATIANVNAIAAGGGSPGDIPITSLDIGTATANEFIRINSGGTAVIGDTVANVKTAVLQGTRQGTSFTAVINNRYILADNITVTLPASPSDGDSVYFVLEDNIAFSTGITLARNGNTIVGRSEDMTVDDGRIPEWTMTHYNGDWRVG